MGLLSRQNTSDGSAEITTTIGPEAYFHGVVTVRGSLKVEGEVEGNIHEALTVVIGHNGRVRGDVCAEHVVVGGSIQGHIVASRQLEILSGGKVRGDIKTPKLLIEEGALFEGNCAMGEKAEGGGGPAEGPAPEHRREPVKAARS
jgi:cytoskeletal protein CcmA (bactofilin family)